MTSDDRLRLIEVNRQARAFYRDQLLRADGPRRYLGSRGLGGFVDPRQGEQPWQLGYAPAGWTKLIDHLSDAGYTAAELLAAGLARHTRRGGLVDLFRDRIMFPVHNPTGNPIAFLGRAAPGAGPNVPKYINTPDTALYHKGQTLYGMGEQVDAIGAGAAPVLVEGPTDVLAIALAFPQAEHIGVAQCGTSLTTHHATAVAAIPGATRHGLTVALDNDDAGRQATERAWQLMSVHANLALYAASLPNHLDPADLVTQLASREELRTALTDHVRPLAEVVIDLNLDALTARHPDVLRWPEGRVSAARTMASLIGHLPAEQIITLTGHIAERTRTGYETVAAMVIANVERLPPHPTIDLPVGLTTRGHAR